MSGTDDLRLRRGGYVPTFSPQRSGPGDALLAIAGAQLDAVAARLAQAPDKRGLAVLDLVGVGLVAASAARTPVVFQASPGLDHVTAPAGTRLAATVPGSATPLVFETERAVAIAAARLVEVASVVPGQDAFTSHMGDLAAGATVTLFDTVTMFGHELYLGHRSLLALSGRSTVEIIVSLRGASGSPLVLEGSWWDGSHWRAFAPMADPAGDEDSSDGTGGLTRGGTIRLFSPCADSEPLVVRGIESSWIRLRVREPIPSPLPEGARIPLVERLQVRTIVERRRVAQRLAPSTASTVNVWSPGGAPVAAQQVTLRDVTAGVTTILATDATGAHSLSLTPGRVFRVALGPAPAEEDWLPTFSASSTPTRLDLLLQRGMLPDKALSDGRALDPTKSFVPLGQNPEPGAALYLACADAFTRPGAQVALDIRRPRTAAELGDDQAATYEVQINAAIALVHSIEDQLNHIAGTLDMLRVARDLNGIEIAAGPLGEALPNLLNEATAVWYQRLKGNLATLINLAGSATNQITDLIDLVGDILTAIFAGDAARNEAEKHAAEAAVSIARALEDLGVTDPNLVNNRTLLETTLTTSPLDVPLLQATRAALQLQITIIVSNPGQFMTGTIPPFLTMLPEDYIALVSQRIGLAVQAVLKASTDIRAIVALLLGFNPANLLAANGGLIPALTPPVLAWEYWEGTRWDPLPGLDSPHAGPTPHNLQASGIVRFTVPDGWVESEVAGDRRRWLRARLASGHYARLRVVTWTDAKSNLVNVLPVIEPRPPTLDAVEITYRSASDLVAPEHAVSCDDAQWRDHTAELSWPGAGFQPFRACRDTSPTLYLGFEAPLPAETVGLLLDIEERDNARPTALRFEAWTGSGFVPIPAEDGTRGLTTSGVVYVVPPQDTSATSFVVRGNGTTVELGELGAALRYAPGASLWLADQRGGELFEVASRAGESITATRPLSRPYAGGLVRQAPPARFGRPLTWLRVLLDADAEPPAVRLRAVAPNAVWAANVQTVSRESAGGSDGTPGQVHFLRRWPVLDGESVEVREVAGPRAAVDAPILADELEASDVADALRLTRDDTGRVTEAWVRWQARDTLAFSDGTARVYTIDRTSGRIIFGDGKSGRIPPAAPDNIVVSYRAGGGEAGNLPAGAISTVLSGVLARGVVNPSPAEGGAGGETLDGLRSRGPQILRHRHQAMSASDYEALALEASAAIARVRALGAVDAAGRPMPGCVRVILVPRGDVPAPQPDAELRRRVGDLLRARAPMTASGGPSIVVTGPRYQTIGVNLDIRCADPNRASAVREGVRMRTLAFLHPITGGDGAGFAFGARLATSDLARTIARLPGVDAVVSLSYLLDGLPQGEFIALRPDALPAAGQITVSLTEVT